MLLPNLLAVLPPILPQLFMILRRVLDWENQGTAPMLEGAYPQGEKEEYQSPVADKHNNDEDITNSITGEANLPGENLFMNAHSARSNNAHFPTIRLRQTNC